MKKQTKFVSLSTRIIIGLVGVIAFAIFTSGYLSYHKAHQLFLKDALSSMENELQQARSMFRQEINTFEEDVVLLSDSLPVGGIMRSRQWEGYPSQENTVESVWKSRLEMIFTTILKTRLEYLQVRFIGADHNGREIVRVDRTKNGIEVVAPDQFQEKGSRDYFLKTKSLGKNKIYISRIDLNRENGTIVVPYQPMLRVATPIYNAETDEFFGIIIINVGVEALFKRVFKRSKLHFYEVANDQGFYLLHENPKRTYGFEFDQENKLQNDHPQMQDFLSASYGENYVQRFSIYDDQASNKRKEILIASKFKLSDQDGSKTLIINLISDENIILVQSKELANTIVIVNMVVMLLLLLFVLVAVRKGLKPLVFLSESTKAISKGIFPEAPLEIRRNDEIGEVTASFNDMIVNLKSSTISIDVLNKEIEERKNAEKTIEEIARMPRETPSPILRVSSKGVLMFANEASEGILKEWGCKVGDDVPQEYKRFFRLALEKDEIQEVEVSIGDRDYEATLAPQKEYGYVNLYTNDVSSRVVVQNNLKESLKELEDFKVALDAHAIVAITDVKGKITYANDKFSEISQYPHEELIGKDHRILNSGYHSKEFMKDLWMTIELGA
ncbi:Sensory box/GGDEF family protein, partial [hydrothermal vent metagenome]